MKECIMFCYICFMFIVKEYNKINYIFIFGILGWVCLFEIFGFDYYDC